MTSTPPKFMEDSLCESWVELNAQSCVTSERTTPLPFASSEEYLRLLKEAQRESGHSSAQISKASSRIDTPRDSFSPKSPPNSPNTELSTEDDHLKGVYINFANKDELVANFDKSTDWIWDWSSRPDQAPPKDWKFRHPKSKSYSMRYAKVGKNSLFSKEVMYTLFVTNIISILLGTGVGMWLSRRGMLIASVSVN
ncbi:BCL2/adenovirus E1B 19 kDa protein-interacting protein 3 [Diaphorina citri]|uniref:BCL2/adenovirus E1B 19 kDa protein-interacting protein 3 n=1 Tax=Diaphorina citri TaxID=121845 RepID=A0A3Q0JL49_DIACI|nr:BCL2/adenovirus E1B 19 kDa protein-interacting protein 3 [Diaphorina citri]